MSNNLKTAKTNHTDGKDINVTSYSAGKGKGQMLQLHQNNDIMNIDILHADEEQVRDLVATLNKWLDR